MRFQMIQLKLQLIFITKPILFLTESVSQKVSYLGGRSVGWLVVIKSDLLWLPFENQNSSNELFFFVIQKSNKSKAIKFVPFFTIQFGNVTRLQTHLYESIHILSPLPLHEHGQKTTEHSEGSFDMTKKKQSCFKHFGFKLRNKKREQIL